MRRTLVMIALTTASLASAQPSAPPLPAGAETEAPAGHAHAHGGGDGAIFRPPADSSDEDAALPAGTIIVRIVDGRDQPLAGIDVTLGVMEQSVAKGESRKHLAARTDDKGLVTWSGQMPGDAIAYRVSVSKDGAKFSAMPFRLREKGGVRVTLHVYPVTHRLEDANVFVQGAIFVDVKDDRVQIQQALRVSNFSASAWVPEGLVLELPEGFSAFNASQSMSDQGFDQVAKGAKLRGTFGPGETDLGFSWQLPYSGDPDVSFELAMPPRMASMIVRAAASGSVRLEAESRGGTAWSPFPAPEADRDEQGNRLLVTGKQLRPNDAPLERVRVSVRDLPTQGNGRWVAVGLSALAVGVGLVVYGRRRERTPAKGAAKSERAAWLEELEALERAFGEGEVGPKTYERARREIIDGLARTLVRAK